MSVRVSIHHVYCVKQGVYWQVCGMCMPVYGSLQLQRDSFYFRSNVQYVYRAWCGSYILLRMTPGF